MAKKNLSLPRRNSESRILGYRLPRWHDTAKGSYVDYYVTDYKTGKLRRFKVHLEKYTSKVERSLHATLLINTLSQKLLTGWNPTAPAQQPEKEMSMSEALTMYRNDVTCKNRDTTKKNYLSRAKIFEDFLNMRTDQVVNVSEYSRALIVEFIDYVLHERETGARTVNNYIVWCQMLGEYFVDHGWLPTNPATGIQRMSVSEKKRQPLTNKMLHDLKDMLEKEDRWFLLACEFAYLTLIRPREMSFIKIGDISIKEQRIYVSGEISKNKRDSYVGLSEELIMMMLNLGVFKHSNDEYLFSEDFKPGRIRLHPDRFNKRWGKIRQLLGWGMEYQFYSLKDSGIRDLANAAGIVVARDQARHSDVSTTNRYLGASKEVHEATKGFRGAFRAGGKTLRRSADDDCYE
ncbi:MAG: site-specific integrase [Muribaculaceae bacterium]|nr:site-specific integrase [Muribaculaceae bacterium]